MPWTIRTVDNYGGPVSTVIIRGWPERASRNNIREESYGRTCASAANESSRSFGIIGHSYVRGFEVSLPAGSPYVFHIN